MTAIAMIHDDKDKSISLNTYKWIKKWHRVLNLHKLQYGQVEREFQNWKFVLNIIIYLLLFLIIRFYDYSYISHWRSQIGMHSDTKSKNKFMEFRIWDSAI